MADAISSATSPRLRRSGLRDRHRRAKSDLIVLHELWNRPEAHRLRIALLALGVFALDTAAGLDVIAAVLYVIVVLLAMRSGRRSEVAIAGWGSVGLTVVSFLLTVRPGVPFMTALLNTALSILAIICVTILCLRILASQAEVLRARDRIALVSRGIFLKTISASVVHEVTQPITAIGANAEAAYRWLDQSPPNLDETKTATRRIVRDVERVSALVGRLRRSITPGAIISESCDVLALVTRAVGHLQLEIEGAAIEVKVTGAPGHTIKADGVLIEQVVVNALSNAIDALRAVDPRAITVELRPLPDRVQISIKDNGMGVDDATREAIFDPFFSTKAGSGMGIGLAVSKSIVEAHGGVIRAIANAPRGLVIEVTLPVRGCDPR